ncbi:ribbon-helix-helix domain-containing protein [Microcella sp.]|uniref:ribbon-helix-helix domain-containing protein n=1 Tax=Microcella sp. TaxID=1913979 RepID=UPI00299F69FC|nr:ribbon-helix-helix domain-containing protein [Microcella sp.]MDX2025141.1 ribbon-helix-helix domain-containing protein [Microcella sp.]
MTAKTVGFAIGDDERALLDELVEHYGGGNRSEFLRVAIRRLARDRRAERLQALQQEAHEQLGRVVTPDEVRAAVAEQVGRAA